MERKDVIAIVEGLRLIEEGVSKIQAVMRDKKIKSLKEMAEDLIPMLQRDDEAVNESILEHLNRGSSVKS